MVSVRITSNEPKLIQIHVANADGVYLKKEETVRRVTLP